MMRRFFISFAPWLAALVLGGCGVPTPSHQSGRDLARITGELPEGQAMLFVHIPDSMPAVKATVVIDGREVAKLPAGAFTKVTLSPGRHRIGVKYPPLLGRKVADYSLPAEPGLSYHLKLADGGGPQRMSGSAITNEFTQANARLMPMAATDGMEYARRETYSPAR